MARRKKIPNCPWFNPENYTKSADLDYTGWLEQLILRWHARENHEIYPSGMKETILGLKSLAINLIESCGIADITPIKEADWLIGAATLLTASGCFDGLGAMSVLELHCIGHFFNEQMRKPLKDHQMLLETNGRAFISVPLDLPDGVLMKQFKQWLENRRKSRPPKLTKMRRQTWAKCCLLQWLDLKHWNQRTGAGYSDSALFTLASNKSLDCDEDTLKKTTKPEAEKVMSFQFLEALAKITKAGFNS